MQESGALGCAGLVNVLSARCSQKKMGRYPFQNSKRVLFHFIGLLKFKDRPNPLQDVALSLVLGESHRARDGAINVSALPRNTLIPGPTAVDNHDSIAREMCSAGRYLGGEISSHIERRAFGRLTTNR